MTLAAVARHDLVRLIPSAWRAVLAARPDLGRIPLLTDWAARGWPLVARRRAVGDPPGSVTLGLPLPPRLGKARLAFAVPPDAIAGVEPPPPLAALARVPVGWRASLDALLALGRRCGAEPRAFGSFAFAHLTGLDYVTPASDIDALWPLTARTPALLAALPAIEAGAPGRLDGEIVDAAGCAANWRELAGATDVLVKSLDGVTLVAAAAFLGGIAA